MAMFKDSALLRQNQSDVFDEIHAPRTPSPFSGIYRCDGCGYETASTENHPLPSQNHLAHPSHIAIKWRLIVCAQSNS